MNCSIVHGYPIRLAVVSLGPGFGDVAAGTVDRGGALLMHAMGEDVEGFFALCSGVPNHQCRCSSRSHTDKLSPRQSSHASLPVLKPISLASCCACIAAHMDRMTKLPIR